MLGVHQAACYRDVMEGRTGNTWASQVCNRAWRLLSGGPRDVVSLLATFANASCFYELAGSTRKSERGLHFGVASISPAPPGNGGRVDRPENSSLRPAVCRVVRIG